jgi:hypothetical protein
MYGFYICKPHSDWESASTPASALALGATSLPLLPLLLLPILPIVMAAAGVDDAAAAES